MIECFFTGNLGVGDGLSVFIGTVLWISSLELKVENLVCWLPVFCSGEVVATNVTRLGPLPGRLRVLDLAGLTGPILVGGGIFSALTIS